MRPKVTVTGRDQSYQELSRNDDYFSVVQKLGDPAQDRWKSEMGALQFRALSYPQRGYTVILMGSDRTSAHYTGTLDSNWRLLRSTGKEADSLLRALGKF